MTSKATNGAFENEKSAYQVPNITAYHNHWLLQEMGNTGLMVGTSVIYGAICL